ncbi:hypothetical protein A2U01_0053718, partial [Trifolium medium]|nr:hypothetical protein [Trifolium medium]
IVPHVVVSSLSLTEETTETLTSPSPLPTLPFDLIAEILCRQNPQSTLSCPIPQSPPESNTPPLAAPY